MNTSYETSKAAHICLIEKNEKMLFLLWEFIASEGMQDEAREYIESREDLAVPISLHGWRCPLINGMRLC